MKGHPSSRSFVWSGSIFFTALYILKHWIFNNLNIYPVFLYTLIWFYPTIIKWHARQRRSGHLALAVHLAAGTRESAVTAFWSLRETGVTQSITAQPCEHRDAWVSTWLHKRWARNGGITITSVSLVWAHGDKLPVITAKHFSIKIYFWRKRGQYKWWPGLVVEFSEPQQPVQLAFQHALRWVQTTVL